MNINSEASGSVSNTNSSTSIKYNLHSPEWFNVICEQVVKDMNTYGLCVIDNFLGASRGDRIYNEVKSMFSHGLFKDGELVNKRSIESKTIRGDKIIWINGTEPYCPNIGFLMRTLDAILLQCNNMEDNGCFGKYKLTSRTKAMLACYPGCGTHYVKHVDNPNEDGREITGIYYLNKNWNVEVRGFKCFIEFVFIFLSQI